MILDRLVSFGPAQRIAQAALLRLEPETAHRATLNALSAGLVPKLGVASPRLQTRLAGLSLANPLGIAPGFDKNAEVPDALIASGFGFVEVGTVTPRPQQGNPRPRVFRLSAAGGIINRLGFNNEGHDIAYERLALRPRTGTVGINIGANKDSPDFVADYTAGVARFCAVADYLTVNVSSPNTPGLRNLQADEALARLLGAVVEEREKCGSATPLFLKIAPDLDLPQLDAIARVILASGIDGLIVSNTTLSRDTVAGDPQATESGGLSGKPLFRLSTARLAQMRERLGRDFPLIGVGGVHSVQTALAKFEAGANAIQLYSALIYSGLPLAADILRGLDDAVRARGLTSVADLTGTKTAEWARGAL